MRYDVAVVGGGPAGAAAARSARDAGALVALLERHEQAPERICGEYLCPGGVDRLKSLGMESALAATGATPLLGIRLFSPEGREVKTRFPEGRAGASVRRSRFDPALCDLSGADVMRGAHVVAVERRGDGVRLQTRSGVVVEAAVVIGADGRHGVVARQCSLHQPPPPTRRATVHAIFTEVGGCEPFGEMHLPGDGTYVGVNPGGEGRVNITWVGGLDAARETAPRLKERLVALPSLRERFSGAHLEGEVRLLAPLEVRARRCFGDRVLLAGDAAGFLDPLTGEGMFGALGAGAVAGAVAARAARAGDASQRSLAAYARERRRVLGRKEGLNRFFQWMLNRRATLEFLRRRFEGRPHRGDAFIAVVGNVAGPARLLRILLPGGRA